MDARTRRHFEELSQFLLQLQKPLMRSGQRALATQVMRRRKAIDDALAREPAPEPEPEPVHETVPPEPRAVKIPKKYQKFLES